MDSLAFKYNNSDIVYWVWLSLVCGAGSPVPEMLFSRFGRSAKAIYDATPEEYEELHELKKNIVAALNDKNLSKAVAIIRWCNENGVGMLPYDSEYFPNSLRIINNAPILLYYLGHVPDINHRLSIAIVGTRNSTTYGSNNTYTISNDLALAGAVVVSGMALGVDGAAHRGALDAGGYTITVLGCGIDRVYPKEHINLMREIAIKGTIITEYCPGTLPLGKNFPIRNRIISGLSQGVVVSEADTHSGALITAKHAEAQGRPIFALPGKVGEFASTGTNQLIKNGGKMITDAFDILEDYMESYASVLNVDNIMNKLCKYRTDFKYKKLPGTGNLTPYPKLGKYNSSPGRVYTKNSADSPHTPIATEVEELNFSPLPDKKKRKTQTQKKPAKQSEAITQKSPELEGDAKSIYELIPSDGGITYDELLRRFPDRGTLMMTLTELEMAGLIASGRGGYTRK